MTTTLNGNLASSIYAQAVSQGVPPSIALAVAQQESGIAQWTPSGNLVTGSAGEIGVFQLMPATAAGLGVDPTDVNENVAGGVSLLAQLYAQYGNWAQALSAYNSGNPNASPAYAASVLSIAGGDPDAASIDDSDEISSMFGNLDPDTVLIGGVVVLGLALWWMEA